MKKRVIVNMKKEGIFKQLREFFESGGGEKIVDADGFLKVDKACEALGLPNGHSEKILVAKGLTSLGAQKVFKKPDGGYCYRFEIWPNPEWRGLTLF
jgi:hypothetical protein